MKIAHMRSSVLLLSLVASSVFASPSVNIGTALETVDIGGSVDIPITLNTDGDVQTLNFDFTFDDTQFTATKNCVPRLPNSTGDPFSQNTVTCNISGNTVSVVVAPVVAEVPPTLNAGALDMGFISFQSQITTPDGEYALPIGTEVYGGADGAIPAVGSTDGLITVVPPPQPMFNITVTGEDPSDMAGEIGTTIESMLEVDNDSGEVGSILNYTCALSGEDVAKFTLTGDTTDFDVAQDGTHGFMTLACNSSELGTFTTNLGCVHNDLPNTPWGDTVSCTVNEGPLPQFTGVDSGLSTMNVPEQGDADATATLTVTNSGDDGTTLIGECIYAGSTEISVTGGSFAVATGSNAVVTATCSGAAEGSYDGTLTCGPTDPQTWVAADSPYAVHCDVGPPGDAVYSSDPVPGSTIDMTPPGTPAIEDSDVDDQFLVITNAAPEANDRDLALINCGFIDIMPSGSSAIEADIAGISASAVVSPLAPNEFTTVTFSCDTSEAGDYVETYRCGYDQDGDGVEDQASPATYTVKCSVREPESDVSVSPASGTQLNINVAIGGSGQTSVRFGETLDEGLDGTLEGCSLDDDTYFSIVSDNDYPIMIPAGDFFDVVVQGFAPGDPSIQASAVLTCEYSDSDSDGDEASWPIDIIVMSAAIPTLSTWSLLAMILALMGLAGVTLRRRNNM